MNVKFGNVALNANKHRGWFIGHFVGDASDLEHTDEVEVKWGTHRKGEDRAQWSSNQATTMSVLIRGRFTLTFADTVYVLAAEGDYVIWAPGVLHRWRADEDTLILTVRWPSEKT
jgi:quercetin dioxygenase-like cupin family protein